MKRSDRLPHALASLALLPLLAGALPAVRAQGALFDAREVDQTRFVLVAAPIGDGTRAQLNIYEQISNRRPCFATSGSSPARVDPLLGSFDFTGICTRYIDANGYSLRVGGTDLATVYRLSVVRQGSDNILLAAPTRGQSGPEMIVARTNGHDSGFLQFVPEPGWRLMRRHFGNRALGHVYLYRESWPGQETAAPTSSAPAPVAPMPAAPKTPPPAGAAPAGSAPSGLTPALSTPVIRQVTSPQPSRGLQR